MPIEPFTTLSLIFILDGDGIYCECRQRLFLFVFISFFHSIETGFLLYLFVTISHYYISVYIESNSTKFLLLFKWGMQLLFILFRFRIISQTDWALIAESLTRIFFHYLEYLYRNHLSSFSNSINMNFFILVLSVRYYNGSY